MSSEMTLISPFSSLPGYGQGGTRREESKEEPG